LEVRRRKAVVRHENASYWMSYSDIMAALLLMLVLLLFFYVNQYIGLQAKRELELAAKEAELRTQEDLLTQTENLLAQKAEELASARGQLNNQEQELQDKNTSLEEALAKLAQQQLDYRTQAALLALAIQEADATRAQLDLQQESLDTYAQQLTDKDKELILQQLDVEKLQALLENQQWQIDQLVGVRAQIIAQLRDSLASAALNVNVDQQTGAITLDSSVVFDYGQSTIKAGGRAFLDEFIPIYVRTLLLGGNGDYVSELIVEGHTDSVGSYDYNLNLSQQRASAVVRYVLGDYFTGLSQQEKLVLREKLTANGRSFSAPVYRANGMEDAEASRRVEFKFRLKDAEMINSMSQILSGAGN
jgi:chemotaxis protein MotB